MRELTPYAENIIENVYRNATLQVEIGKICLQIKLQSKEVSDRRTLYPQNYLHSCWKTYLKLSWQESDINNDGKRLNHLQFADYIFIISNEGEEIKTVAEQFHQVSKNVDLSMNLAKPRPRQGAKTQFKLLSTTISAYLGKQNQSWRLWEAETHSEKPTYSLKP